MNAVLTIRLVDKFTRFRFIGAVLCAACLHSLAGAQESKKLEIPKPEVLRLEARDGFAVAASYYPGGFYQKSEKEVAAKPGKEVVPVILLHGLKGSRREMEPLALMLQRLGHAVVSLDLRGHGDSISRIKLPNGNEKEVDPGKFGSTEFRGMELDVEAAKKFLLEKNNTGALNLELLCVVGAELGGIVATNWIAADWSRQDLPAFKQGKYAKALVILSPVNSVKGYTAATAWKHPIFQSPRTFSIMFVAGKRDAKSSSETKQVKNRIEKSHPTPEDEKERVEKQSLFVIEPDTELAGSKLVDPRARLNISVSGAVAQFINLRLVAKQAEYPWAERKNPLAGN